MQQQSHKQQSQSCHAIITLGIARYWGMAAKPSPVIQSEINSTCWRGDWGWDALDSSESECASTAKSTTLHCAITTHIDPVLLSETFFSFESSFISVPQMRVRRKWGEGGRQEDETRNVCGGQFCLMHELRDQRQEARWWGCWSKCQSVWWNGAPISTRSYCLQTPWQDCAHRLVQ